MLPRATLTLPVVTVCDGTKSVKLFHSWQPGQQPAHFAVWYEQLVQAKAAFDFDIGGYSAGCSGAIGAVGVDADDSVAPGRRILKH